MFVFKPPSLWYSIIAAQMDYDRNPSPTYSSAPNTNAAASPSLLKWVFKLSVPGFPDYDRLFVDSTEHWLIRGVDGCFLLSSHDELLTVGITDEISKGSATPASITF